MSSNLKQKSIIALADNNSVKDILVNLEENQSSISLELALKILELGTFEERWDIAKVLVKYGNVVIEPLRNVVLNQGADSEYRWYALKILSELANPEVIFIVSQLLEITDDEDLISLGTQTLANQGKASISLLSQLLETTEYNFLATKALTQIPNALVIQPLLSVINDPDSQIRLMAISAISNFDTPPVIEALINALQDPVSLIRKEALNGLGLRAKYHSDIDLVKLIEPFLFDFNLNVCQQAALSLSRLQNDLAVEKLFNTLQTPHTPVPLQITLVRALAWMETPKSIDCLGKCLDKVSCSIILEIINVFGRMSSYSNKKEIILILLSFYHSNSSAVQESEILQALCYTWKKLQAFEAIDVLRIIANHSNDRLRFHAESALNEILDNVSSG